MRHVCVPTHVDFPLDVVLYRRGSFEMIEHRYARQDLSQISDWWQEKMRSAVAELPLRWVESAFSKLDSARGPVAG